MFRKWLETNTSANYDLTAELYPPADNREFWGERCEAYYVSQAEKFLGFDIPPIRATQYMEYPLSGDRRAQERPHFSRRMALCSLVLGEVAEYKGRFIPDIIDLIFAICEESFWGVSAHVGGMPDVKDAASIDLFAAETASLLAMACHLLREELDRVCPRLIPKVEWEIRRRIFDTYINRTDYAWMGYGYPVNNWTPWIISNMLTVFLLCERDKAVLSRAIDKMLYEINTIYTSLPEDGGCDEGACYWAVSGGCLFEFCDQLYVASRGEIDFFNDEKLRRVMEFEYRAYIGGGYFANFADGTPKVTHSMVGLLYAIGLRLEDARFKFLAKELLLNDPEREKVTPLVERDAKIKRRLYEMMYSRDIRCVADVTPKAADILECLQVALLHSGRWCIAAKGGHNAENHNHNDVGSFIAYCDDAPVLVDPSCGTYTGATFSGNSRYDIWTHHSGWHNVPVLNGQRQKDGREYRADSFSLEDGSVKVSFAEAYPKEAEALSVCRSVRSDGEGVVLHDSITLHSHGDVTEHFITPLTVRIDGDRVILGEKFLLQCNGNAAVTTDSVSFEGDEKLALYWKTEGMNRVAFTFTKVDSVDTIFTLREI